MAERLRYPRDRVVVIPRGRDPVRLGRRTPERRAAARASLGVADDEQVILAVGRLEHQKGFDRLLRAMPDLRASHPRAVLRIAGKEGRDSAALRSAAAALGLEPDAVFLGERSDIPDLLCAADLFVLASRREGMPGALLEAMALEVPLLTSDLPVVHELLGDDAPVVADDLSWATRISEALSIDEGHPSWRSRFEDEFTIRAQGERLAAFWRPS
jgi:glycosyltransferase involved in cell wall biosynthesis